MNFIRLAIERPIAVLSAVMMVVLAGFVALQEIPIQLTPDINKPVITVTTRWPGAAPAEVEREIINRQEDVLRGIDGLVEMSSESNDGNARVKLEFEIDQDLDRALLVVSNRLDQVTDYPEEADEPLLTTAGADDQPIAWMIVQRLPGVETPIHHFGDFAQDVIADRLQRVPGVADINVYGGSERELKVIVDPPKLARYELTVPDVVRALRDANVSLSAGDVKEGKRRYVVRTEGELIRPELVRAVLLRSLQDTDTGRVSRVTVGDVADVRFGYKEPTAYIRQLGEPAIALNAVRETGANVIETLDGVRRVIEELRRDELPNEGLTIKLVYEETTYINSAIELVRQNIWVGGLLAAAVLMIFLRSGRATLVVTLAIPISIVGAFVAMAALGRSINVISLAGIAFAVGMVVDAAIVVLENIFRLRQQGLPPARAAYEGARQVWGAIFASAATTVVVFVPLLILELEVGQLFRDIAVAISVSVLLSLIVAITVIPSLAARLLRGEVGDVYARHRVPVVDDLSRQFVRGAMAATRFLVARRLRAISAVALVCAATAAVSWLLLPKLEYLPEGNRNLVLAILQPPPGYNLDTTTSLARNIEGSVDHLFVPEGDPDFGPDHLPGISHFFFVAFRNSTFVGAKAVDAGRIQELIPLFESVVFQEPGTFGFVRQPSMFGRAVSSGRSIDLNVSGPELEPILSVAVRAMGLIDRVLPRSEGTQIRPLPGLELGAPEVRLYPDPTRLADGGVSARDFSETIDAFNDGLRVAEVNVEGDRIDLMLAGPEDDIAATQGIGSLPVITSSGLIVPASSLASVVVTAGPTQIRHLERERTVTLQIRPTTALALEEAMELLQTEVIDALQAEGLPAGTTLDLAGTADELTATWQAMVWQILLAIAVVYLVISVLFESFLFPAIIVLSVPLATAGGAIGLALVNLYTYQPLDMLTLLGFVILIGTVVNNAILLVYQTLANVREEAMEPRAAILAATANRIRPIFMATLTSVFGMLPLVLFPGAGSELYRGLGSVVVGGLAFSAVLTLAIIPPLLSLAAPAIGGKTSVGEGAAVAEPRAAE
jgi:HAE1 family hydrophobic/amphiphilic exporter-1